jgi:LmbE family N-acetylglucosaminyl deacetylase
MKARALYLFFLLPFSVLAQAPHSGEILLQLQRLGNPQRALYLAAHPDDENTRLIAWLANHKKAETAYLSLTRGDGGQNLIGPELGDLLGIIRSHELVEARKIDYGQQFFSRARDFGYSKSFQETETIWKADSVLLDMVRVLREFRPHVLITRFSPQPGGTHGHHTSSARLGLKAVELAANSNYRPDLGPAWAVTRTLWNTSWWFFQNNPEALLTDSFSSVFVGHYVPERGLTIQEIAALARSQHKSQGFGTMPAMLDTIEYFQVIQGQSFVLDPLDGIPATLAEIPGGLAAKQLLDSMMLAFNPLEPQRLLPGLFRLRTLLGNLNDKRLAFQKIQATEQLIQYCAGIRLRALASKPIGSQDDTLELTLDYGQGLAADIRITQVKWMGVGWDLLSEPKPFLGFPLQPRGQYTVKAKANNKAKLAQPYWLELPGSEGAFYAGSVQQTQAIGSFEPGCQVRLAWNGYEWHQTLPLLYISKDPVKGELIDNFRLLPKITLNPVRPAAVAMTVHSVQMPVTLQNHSPYPCRGKLQLSRHDTWSISPLDSVFEVPAGGTKTVLVDLLPKRFDGKTNELSLCFVDEDGEAFDRQWSESRYDHIGRVGYLPRARIPALALAVTQTPRRISFLPGAGEATPEMLKGAGLSIQVINEQRLLDGLIDSDVILVGIRALNISSRPDELKTALLQFAERGGHVVMQYTTVSGLANKEILPGLKLGRQRITDERAPIYSQPTQHYCLQRPLAIEEKDWKGWVQERGLYFAESWSSDWIPVLQGADPGEPQQSGMLLIRPYGNGQLVYTGLSFFRQIPAAVPGAYALLFNLLHL